MRGTVEPLNGETRDFAITKFTSTHVLPQGSEYDHRQYQAAE